MTSFRPFAITDLMTLISSLSKETSNSYNDIMNMPGHILLGIYNTLVKIFEEEKKRQEDESSKYKSSIPSMTSGNYNIGNINPSDLMRNFNM